MKNKKFGLILGAVIIIQLECMIFFALLLSQNRKIEKLNNDFKTIQEENTNLLSEINNIKKLDVKDIYEKNKLSVIKVVPQTELEAYGSGVIWDEDDEKIYFLTNSHIVKGRKSFMIEINGENVVSYTEKDNSQKDIATAYILKEQLTKEQLDSIKVIEKNENDIDIGDTIYAIGNNLGDGISITDGILSNKDVEMMLSGKRMTLYQTTAAINHGASGGACVDKDGKFVGLITAKVSDVGVDNTGMFIPFKNIDTLLNEIDEQTTTSIFNSLLIIDVDSTMKSNGIEEGAFVRKIDNNHKLNNAGLRNNDIIIKINNVDIKDLQNLEEITKDFTNDTEFNIVIKRYDFTNEKYEEKTIEVKNK